MITLDFKGPFHFEHLKFRKDVCNPGIYIWGFVYEFDKSGLTNPINFSETIIPDYYDDGVNLQPNWKFIPHYVGKSLSNMYEDRLIKHHNVRNRNTSKKGDADKYKRFTFDYLKDFFIDSCFPPYTGKSTDKDYEKLLHNSKIVYLNNKKLPITNSKFNKVKDTLDIIVTKYNNNNFFVFFKDLDKSEVNEYTEAFVYWSLKGKTISRTLPLDKVILFKDCITIKADCNIFKSSPSSNFPGY